MHLAHVTTLALMAWSAVLIVSGSVWVLASQVGKLCDLIEKRTRDLAAPCPESADRVASWHHQAV